MAESDGNGKPGDAGESLFDSLAAEGEAASATAPEPEAEAAPAVTEDPTICRRGPCIHFVSAEIPSGITVGASGGGSAVVANQRCSCRMGVQFEERRADQRTAFILGASQVLPIDCTAWAPMTEEEIADLDRRRMAEQDRHAAKLEAEAVLAATKAEAAIEKETTT